MDNEYKTEAIDPEQVVMDPEVIDPNQVVMDDPGTPYAMTKNDRKRVVRAFQGEEPLSFIADEEDRADVVRLTEDMQDRDEYRKKMLLAAWFNLRSPKVSYQFILGNMDLILKKYYNEKKPVSVDRAYQDIKEMYYPSVSAGDFFADEVKNSTTGRVLTAGAAGAAKTLGNMFFTFLKAAPGMSGAIMPDYEIEKAQEKEIVDTHKEWNRTLDIIYNENRGAVLDDGWIGKWENGRWFRNALVSLGIEGPRQVLQMYAASYLGPLAFAGLIGASSGIDKFYDLEFDDDNRMTAEQKAANAFMTGVINSGAAWILGSVVQGKLPKLLGKQEKLVLQDRMKSYLKFWGEAIGWEAGQETLEQLAENSVDLYTGVHGDVSKMSAKEIYRHLGDGVAESGFSGGIFGGIGGLKGFKSYSERVKWQNRAIVYMRNYQQELRGRSDLTADEVRLESMIDKALNTGDEEMAVAVLRAAAELRKRRRGAFAGMREERGERRYGGAEGQGAGARTDGDGGADGTGENGGAGGTGADTRTGGEIRDHKNSIRSNKRESGEDADGNGNVTGGEDAGKAEAKGQSGEDAGKAEGAGEQAGSPIHGRVQSDGYVYDETATEEEIQQVREITEQRNVMNALPGHDVEDTKEVVRQVMSEMPDYRLRFMHAGEFTPEAEAELKKQGLDPNRVKAWIQESAEGPVMCIIPERVAPQEVVRTVGHEIIGHRGLRAVLGDRYNDFLDGVWKEHSAEIRAYMGAYKQKGDTVESRRYITEEYLSDMANAIAKPKYWKEFLSGCRQAFRMIRPDIRITDTDVEAALSRAGRRVRTAKMRDERGEMKGGGARFDIDGDEGETRPYYKVPFAEGLKRVVDPSQKENRSPVFVSETPEVFRKIGFTALPMMMNARHLRLNYYTRSEFVQNFGTMRQGEHAHGLHDKLQSLPKALEHPLAIVVNMTPNAKPGSVVAITDMDVNGQKVVVPVLIEAVSDVENQYIDSHLVLTVYDSTDWVNTFLTPAVQAEKNGIGIFYFDEKKASRYDAYSKRIGVIPTGFVHNIAQAGINVKPQTETLQFKKWFEDSQAVGNDGKPLVFSHFTGDLNSFTVFESGHNNGLFVPRKGFYFVPSDETSESGLKDNLGNRELKVYLSVQKPLDLRNSSAWKTVQKIAPDLYDSETLNQFVANGYAQTDEFIEAVKKNGFDGIIMEDVMSGYAPFTSWVVFEPTQIKSATDNIGTFDRKNADIRFSVTQYSAEEQQDIVTVLKPFVGTQVRREGKEYQGYLKNHGFEVSEEDALAFAGMAAKEKMRSMREEYVERRDQFLMENNPFFAEAVDYHGKTGAGMFDFVIVPGVEFEGEDFTGSWIAPEYVKYSRKRERRANESDKQYQKYLNDREKALKNAKGISLDELSEVVARKTGRDQLDVKAEMIEFFRDLKKQEFYNSYTKFMAESAIADREAAMRAKAEFLASEHTRIQQEVLDIVDEGSPLTMEWVRENVETAKELYTQMFGKAAEGEITAEDLAEINMGLKNKILNSVQLADLYKAMRENAYTDFSKKLHDYKENIKERNRMRRDQSREEERQLRERLHEQLLKALDFTEYQLTPEERAKYMRQLAGIAEMTNEMQAEKAIEKLMRDVTAASRAGRKARTLEAIGKRLSQVGSRVDGSRKVKGLRDVETQGTLDRIIEISRMDNTMLAMEQEKIQQQITAGLESGGDVSDLEYQAGLLDMYGALWDKEPESIEKALRELNDLARSGKNRLKQEIEARTASDGADRQEFWNAVNGGKKYTVLERKNAADKRMKQNSKLGILKKDFWASLNMEGLLDAVSFFGDHDGETIVDRFKVMAHKAFRDKSTLNRQNTEDLRKKIGELIGKRGSGAIGKAISGWKTVQEKSGVFRRIPDPNGKQYKFSRMSVEEARKALSKYDSTGKGLTDYEAECVRQQLRTLDLKVKYEVPEEFRDGVTDKLVQMIHQEEGLDDRQIVVPVPVYGSEKLEVPLSQMEGLFLKLMWEQKEVRYKMHFAGYTEETISQLDAFLKPEVKELGNWMREQLERDRVKIDEVYQRLYYASFPKVENYFPSVYDPSKVSISSKGVDITQEGAGTQAVSYTPGALKVRVFHLKEPKMADALTVFQNHRLLMNHFVTHAETARKMRSVLLNPNVLNAIVAEHGPDAYNALKKSLECFINGGNTEAEMNVMLQHIHSTAVRMIMNYNIFSGLKQTLGFLSYVSEIPAWKLASGMRYAVSHPKEVWETLGKTDYFRNIWASGGNAELRKILDVSGRAAGQSMLNRLDKISSIALRSGDAYSRLFGGFAVYKYHYENLIKQGWSSAEAKAEALLRWEMESERTQQAASVHMQNALQQSSVGKFLTTFLSNQILMAGNTNSRLYNAMHYKNGSMGRKGMKSMTAILLSSLAMTAMDALKNGDDEHLLSDLLFNAFNDYLCGIGTAGSIAAQAINVVKPGGYAGQSVQTRDAVNLGYAVRHIADPEKEFTPQDMLSLLMAAGYVFPGVGHAASAAREGRKWWKMFNRDER